MKQRIKKALLLALAAVLILGLVLLAVQLSRPKYVEPVSAEEVRWAYELLSGAVHTEGYQYTDFLSYNEDAPGAGTYTAYPEGGSAVTAQDARWNLLPYDGDVVVLSYKESCDYSVRVDRAGLYTLYMDYLPAGNSYLNHMASVSVNGECPYQELKSIVFPLYWQDAEDEITKDRYGDELAPSQVRVTEWRTAKLHDNRYSSVTPLVVPLKAGENTISLENVSNDGLTLGKLTVLPPESLPISYEEYTAAHSGAAQASKSLLTVSAIDYTLKNSAEIIYESAASPAAKPFNSEYKLLNTLRWKSPGDTVSYELEAPESGLYSLSFHYMSQKEEYATYETILVDGEVPFRELTAYAFPYTGGSWENLTLADEEGRPYLIYLTQGKHSLTLKTELEPVTEAWRYGQLVAEHATVFALEIKKIAGEKPDTFRTWKMTHYIPEIPDYLRAYEILLQHIRYLLQDDSVGGVKGAQLSYLDKAEKFIEDISEYPDEIALYTASLSGDDNSILVAVSQFTSSIVKQDFRLNAVYLTCEGEKLPAAGPTLLQSLKAGWDAVYYSMVSEKYKTQVDDPQTLNIWVNRSLQHVDLMQKLVDTEFTPKSGVKVKLTAIPDAGKLTLAAAADNTPDLALGLASYMPFDLACRGALYDMTQFPDFWSVCNRFASGAMVPYVYNEGVYAVPETLDFQAIIYRKDIFNSLDLPVPDTWDELRNMLPSLQRYGMNFYHNCSYGRTGYKWFYQTTPLIFQNGGKLYTEDGTATAIDSVESVRGLKELGDLFVAYSLDIMVNEFFNSFRYSVLPIGIVDSNNYNLILNGALELEGQWELAPFLGTPQEDGTIDRSFVAASTGGCIFADSDKAKEAWDFLKWWTETDTQVTYTYSLRATYGDTYFWLPSNIEALRQAPVTQEDKQVMLDMAEWIRDVPRTPGQYLLERSISDIWNAMVNDGKSAQVQADEKSIEVNREIRKMMRELGYFDDEGNQLKPYIIRDVDWIEARMQEGKEAR